MTELRADIKDLEQAKEEKTAEVASVEDKYSKMWDEYEALRDGYKDKDGTMAQWTIDHRYSAYTKTDGISL